MMKHMLNTDPNENDEEDKGIREDEPDSFETAYSGK